MFLLVAYVICPGSDTNKERLLVLILNYHCIRNERSSLFAFVKSIPLSRLLSGKPLYAMQKEMVTRDTERK